MVALIDKWEKERSLHGSDRVVAVARWMLGTPYNQSSRRDAAPLDGVGSGTSRPLRFTDCSAMVRAVFAEVYPNQGLSPQTDFNTAILRTSDLFIDVTDPQPGDVVMWLGHAGIVVDPVHRILIHAPGAGRPVKYQKDWNFIGTPERFRSWRGRPNLAH